MIIWSSPCRIRRRFSASLKVMSTLWRLAINRGLPGGATGFTEPVKGIESLVFSLEDNLGHWPRRGEAWKLWHKHRLSVLYAEPEGGRTYDLRSSRRVDFDDTRDAYVRTPHDDQPTSPYAMANAAQKRTGRRLVGKQRGEFLGAACRCRKKPTRLARMVCVPNSCQLNTLIAISIGAGEGNRTLV